MCLDFLAFLLGSTGLFSPAEPADSDIPKNLVLDVRIYEARSMSPDYQAMESLSFFIDTDGKGVSELQWLATIARKVPDSFLASLAFETVPVEDASARFELEKRSRTLLATIGLGNFLPQGTFEATVNAELRRGDEALRSFEQNIELRLGQTYVWSGAPLEISASDYLSHFRDYQHREHRGELYERLRESIVYLVVAVTPRLARAPAAVEPIPVELPSGTDLPELESPMDIPLVGVIVLEFDVDDDGAPGDIKIARSSIPEVNPRIVSEAESWRFPDAAGKKVRLTLPLRADP